MASGVTVDTGKSQLFHPDLVLARHRSQFVKKYLNDRGFRIPQTLDEAAKQHHSTPAKVSLAWLIARPSVTAPIASATNLVQLNDLIEATSLQLDHSTLESLNRASAYSAAAR